jgi:glycerol-1-phosphate dehydrogenase [NAD(P)+]
MKMAALERLLSGQYHHDDGTGSITVPTKTVVIRDSLAGLEDRLIEQLGFEGPFAVVSDEHTEVALAGRVKKRLRRLATLIEVVMPGTPAVQADMRAVERISAQTAGAASFIAVGSGTINDLCKFVSARRGRRYAVFATAPSMNGYTSVNASITVQGHKSTLPAQAADGVFYDLEVLAAAPPRMIRAGLGDSLSRPTAQADWLLSHLLMDTEYRELPFELLQEDEPELFENSCGLIHSDLRAIENLVRVLTLSGFGMTLCGGSQPASQGEHLISHYIEMFAPRDWPFSLHGEQIAVTSLTMAGIQQAVLDTPSPRIGPCGLNAESFKRRYGSVLGASCWGEFANKRQDRLSAERLNQRLRDDWDSIREQIDGVMMKPARMKEILRQIDAPTRPEDLGWSTDFYRKAVREAREIRNRYTFLDLAADGGLFEVIGY